MSGSMYMENGVKDALYEILLELQTGDIEAAEKRVRELIGNDEDQDQDGEEETAAYEQFCNDHLPPIYYYGNSK